jgi:hypothetical protein
MSNSVYQTLSCVGALLAEIVRGIPVGTNLNIVRVLFALLSGRFLWTRGAVFPALTDLGLADSQVRCAEASLAYGRWSVAGLLVAWQRLVLSEGRWLPNQYEGIRPVALDLVGFFRPRLLGCPSKHYSQRADKGLPALVFALVAAVGPVGKLRLALPRLILRQELYEKSESDLMRRAMKQACDNLAPEEALVMDAGFSLADALSLGVGRFVMRVSKNFTGRRNALPPYRGLGRRPEFGERVRPLPRRYKGKTIAATKPDKTFEWTVDKRTVRAQVFENLVLPNVRPGAPSFRCVAIRDPRYQEPLLLVTDLSVSAEALYRLYRDRWPIEQLPLAAKQMLGAERAFVFGAESRWRLPELALLAGNVLAYIAAVSQPVASGFWDRCSRPTCGRLRRTMHRIHFSELPLPAGQFRKKASVTEHLPKGVLAHRRHTTTPISGN